MENKQDLKNSIDFFEEINRPSNWADNINMSGFVCKNISDEVEEYFDNLPPEMKSVISQGMVD